ncbi:MAG: hypothetical protein QM773_02885 [Hyphomonadaceae bacterium]
MVEVQGVSNAEVNILFSEDGVDPVENAFFDSLDRNGGADIVIPLIRPSGERVLSIWLSDFLYAAYFTKKSAGWVHVADLPRGRLISIAPECNVFAVSRPDKASPYVLDLYRGNHDEGPYQRPASPTPLGRIEVSIQAGGKCSVAGSNAIASSGLNADYIAAEICQKIIHRGSVEHVTPQCSTTRGSR